MINFNHLRLKGIGSPTDEEYCELFDVPIELAHTPEINESYILAQEDPEVERKNVNFFYALNGLRDQVKEAQDAQTT